MSNEAFFLGFVIAELVDVLHTAEPIIEDSYRVYYFRHYWSDGTSSEYKIRFNQIGGFIDYTEIEV